MSHGGMAAAVRREARIDLEALEGNLRRVVSDDLVLDARANAYGHGLSQVVRLALDAGVRTIRVSPHEADLPGIRRSALMTVSSVRRLVGPEAYGLDAHGIPVMTLVGEVIAVKATPAGSGVSYGYSYRTTTDTTLALVALGYADGVPRLASNRASVAINGVRHPLVGRVAMDQFVVDCGDETPGVGDDVVLFGRQEAGSPLATKWAELTERTALDLTAGIASRVERSYS